MIKVFVTNPKLNLLEQCNKWDEAGELCYLLWKKRKNFENTLRLLAECWYILVENEPQNMESNMEKISAMFKEVFLFGEENYMKDSQYLWISGYFIKIAPWVFEYEDWNEGEKEGLIRILEAEKEKKNLITDILTFKKKKLNKKEIKEIVLCFAGESAIEKYFIDVLCNHY